MPAHAKGVAAGVLVALCIGAAPAGAAPGAALQAGVGQADIQPQTGYYLGGFTRADRVAKGQNSRLYARALILKRGRAKVALVAIELFAVPGGLQQAVAERLRSRGLNEANVVISASHTHSGPGGYANYPAFNTAAPSPETITDPLSFVRLLDPAPADRQLYTFLVDRIATAILRADRNLGPAAAAWGESRLTYVTVNRSIEAHLANHGIIEPPGTGSAAQDPEGPIHTIDPNVDVLRVDKLLRSHGRTVRRPIGAWSNFADHGTVVKAKFEAYNGDHHASAARVFADRVRAAGRVPAGQLVVNIYGNSDEGDQSAGLTHTGPAGADFVGRAEAAAMFRAWRAAGPRLSRRPAIDLRWTRVCFCGQATSDGGHVASKAQLGIPFLTGSEEERGPLFDVTHESLEGRQSATSTPDQGNKIGEGFSEFPNAVPLTVVRVGNRLIASMPGEASKEYGARLKQALVATAPTLLRKVVVAGLANEYLNYITTPEEYGQQHYEGGSTLYGPHEGAFLQDSLVDLARRMAAGAQPPAPYPFDPTHGVKPDGPAYGPGAASGRMLTQPAAVVGRLGHAAIAWQGGPLGLDRPVDKAFVTAQRRVRGRWRTAASDLGLAMLWRVDASGHHTAFWEVPLTQPTGVYRLVVTAKRYRLVSAAFRVAPARTLTLERGAATAGRVAVRLGYPAAVEDQDLSARPAHAAGGRVRFTVNGRRVVVTRARSEVFSLRVPAGARVTVAAGAARDRYGNANGAALALG